jgi:hypothetical protein
MVGITCATLVTLRNAPPHYEALPQQRMVKALIATALNRALPDNNALQGADMFAGPQAEAPEEGSFSKISLTFISTEDISYSRSCTLNKYYRQIATG